MTPSKYQKAIFEAVKANNSNLIVSAVAGSGKTTTIVNSLAFLPKTSSVLFLAFNKSIVEELQNRTKQFPNVEVKTLHSAGLNSLIKTYRCKINNTKYTKFLNNSLFLLSSQMSIDSPADVLSAYKTNVYQLINLSRCYLASTKEEIVSIADKHNLDILADEAEVVLKILDWGKKNFKEVDFGDMIWLPLVKDLNVPKYDFVIVDEAQDLNTAQRTLMLKLIKDSGHFMAVGDPYQSIYGFSGADLESFNKFSQIPNTKQLPLSVCYRCGKKIIEHAQSVMPDIEAFEGQSDGEVNYVEDMKGLQNSDMVLCRVTAPLVSLCLKMLCANKKAYVKGRDIGANLITLVKRAKTEDLDQMFEVLANELYKIGIKICQRDDCSLEEAKKDYAYIGMEDKINCLKNLSFGCFNTKELISVIEPIFKDNSDGICLSTCHKSKGLEANNVWIVCPEKLPLKRCMSVEWQRQQEMNLVYVTITRAKKVLNYVTTPIDKIEF